MSHRIAPNGTKIKERRQALGLKQQDFAKRAHISERTLRNIETGNAPASPHKLQAIATLLRTTVDDLALSPSVAAHNKNEAGQPDSLAPIFELHRVTSASKLLEQFPFGTMIDYNVRDDLTTNEATLIEELLTLVHGVTRRGFYTPWGPHELKRDAPEHSGWFSRLHQQAQLQEIIKSLEAVGMFLFVGRYMQTNWRDEAAGVVQLSTIVHVSFGKTAEGSVSESYWPGLVFDKGTKKWTDPMPF